MKKLVILQFDGDFSTGYKVTLEVGDEGKRPDVRKRGELPPALDVMQSFQEWRKIYASKHGQSRIKVNAVKNFQVVEYKQQCEEYSDKLLSLFNTWLESESFNSIRNYLSELNINQEQELRIILSCDRLELRKLPWHLCNLWSGAEVALSAPDAARGVRILREKIRILIILGDSTGINVKADEMLLQKYCRDAEIVTLVEPSREKLNRYLQDDIGWDILFFSGHSQTQNFTDTSDEGAVQGRIFVNKKDSLTMAELRDSLQTAIQQRLQLAIFNSCDGLGIAAELESLQIPQVIVMREPVPDFVAQEFLKYFLEAFTNGSSLWIAVGYARRQLAMLEDDFPCASWLPVIVQNQLEMPPTWQSLGVTRSPYRGLMAFREEDADNFFGREAFIEQLLIDVNRKPLVAVIGASGSGKSSVVFAGLIPQLRRDENTQWRIISFRPGKNPFESLAVALMGSEEIRENQRCQELELEVELKRDISALARIIADMFGDGSRVLLVVDQFEEIYTLCPNVEERQIFIDGLLNVCVGEQFSTTVVMTLRADFLGKAMSYQSLGKALQKFTPSLLVPMNRAELEKAIIKPAARFSVELEEGLVNKLIDDLGSGEGSLPLQQFALTQLWGKQRPGLLTHQAYKEIGGVTQAVAIHAEAVYAGLSKEQQKRAQRVFIQLVQPGEGTEDTRRLATRDEVGDWDLVTLLANERLLVTNRNELVEDTLEVVHEALIRNWGRLRGWMDDNREFRVWQERLKVALQQWVDSNQDDGGLLRGATLAVAEDWLQKRGEEVSKPQRWFIEKGVVCRERERKQRERLRRQVIGGLATGLVLALSLAGFVGWQWREVQVRETNAQLIAGSLSAEKLLTSNNDLEALIQGVKTGKKLRSSKWVNTDTRMQTVATLAKVVYGAKELNRLQADTPRNSNSICFSPNGEIIASGGRDKIQLWNRQGKILKDIQAEGNFFDSLSFSPDGKILASGDRGKIQFWNQQGEKLYSFKADSHFSYFSFSPDGRTIASSDSTHIKLWNLKGKLIQSFQVSKTNKDLYIPPIKFSFSPDGKNIATLDEEGIKIWDLRGEKLQIFNKNSPWGGKFSVSPDRKKTALINQENETIELDVQQKKGFPFNVKGDASRVYTVMFSQDAKTLASAHDYGYLTIKIWNLQGEELQIFKNNLCSSFQRPILDPHGHIVARLIDNISGRISISNLKSRKIPVIETEIASINGIRFSSDNKIISVTNELGYRKIHNWDLKKELPQRYQISNNHDVGDFDFSRDAKTIAFSYNGRIELWNIDGKLLKNIKVNRIIHNIQLSPDNKTIAFISNGEIQLYDFTGKRLRNIKDNSENISRIAFNHNGENIVYGNEKGIIKILNLQGKVLQVFDADSNYLDTIIKFSPDGKTIVSASYEGKIKILNMSSKKSVNIQAHTCSVNSISFSPDSKIIASASQDGTVKLWNLEGRELKTFKANSNQKYCTDRNNIGIGVASVTFSPSGKTLAYGEFKTGKITLLNLDIDDLLKKSCDNLRDYLKNNPSVSKKDKHLCDDILMS